MSSSNTFEKSLKSNLDSNNLLSQPNILFSFKTSKKVLTSSFDNFENSLFSSFISLIKILPEIF